MFKNNEFFGVNGERPMKDITVQKKNYENIKKSNLNNQEFRDGFNIENFYGSNKGYENSGHK